MKTPIFLSMQITAIFSVFFCLATLATAQDKVVVIPLSSSSGKIPGNTSPCTSAIAGTIRWTGSDFEGCDGSYWGRLGLTAKVPIVFSAGNKWMDRNLGASRGATSMTDSAAYGDLYQWGRGTDGHEKRNSGMTWTLSSSNTPGHGDFITVSSSPYDWRSGQNDNLWQGVSGINNPCPSGFRLPTATEWETERVSWGTNDSAGAYNSPLKLVLAGYRSLSGGFGNVGSWGRYWSATVDGSSSRDFRLYIGNALVDSSSRAVGFSVRCLED